MKWLIKHLCFFSLIFSLNTKAQTVEQNIFYADKCFNEKNYLLCVKEYQRVLFFANADSCAEIYKKLAISYLNTGDFEKAEFYFDKEFFALDTDSAKFESIFSKVNSLIRRNKYEFALLELLALPDSLNRYFTMKRHFFFGLCYWGLENFKQAEVHFIQAIDSNYSAEKQQIKTIFANKKNFNSPNPTTAFVMSLFIPGSGQIYTQHYKDGINSFVLTTTLLILGIEMMQAYTFWDAALAVGPWFQRYYKGGYTNAENFAIEKRYQRRNEAFFEILKIIASTKPTVK